MEGISDEETRPEGRDEPGPSGRASSTTPPATATSKGPPTPEEIRRRVETLLSERRLLTLATCADGVPWACTLVYAFDDDLQLYFISERDTRHVQELSANPDVAITVHEPKDPDRPGRVRGVQLQGTARVLEGDEARERLEVFLSRFDAPGDHARQALFEDRTACLVQVCPDRVWLWDKPDREERLELDAP